MMNDEFHRTQSHGVKTDHYRRLERMYLTAASINDYFKPSITIGDGKAEIRIEVDPKFFHAAGAVHGSVYFKALDDAAYFAANSVVEDVFVLTTNFNIQLLRPVTEGILIAKGTLVSATRSLLIADAELRDDRDRLVGRGTGNFMKSRMKLKDVPGYASE
jgi:uncharacterized protein (TIGR00369 family)